jgi:pyruvate formate lyase activating enzyme
MSTSGPDSNEAMFYSRQGEKVKCALCPHSCVIGDGKRGLCGVRENRSGVLYSLIYGKASSVHPDPIEKKPLFHFLPGTTSISFASIGCNLFCQHCQNFGLSRARFGDYDLTTLTPEDVVRYAKTTGSKSVSWTYNEPTIWHEFTTVASKAAHSAGFKTVYVTNGYIQEEPLRQLEGVIDAMNIDVKAFKDSFYQKICGGKLAPVLRSCQVAVELGIHVELTYLIIPGQNDSPTEMGEFARWVRDSLGSRVPVHFSAFHPDYKMTSIPSTPASTMKAAYDVAKNAGLDFVYLGNIYAGDRDDTRCPKCGTLVIEREGFYVRGAILNGNKCGKCGEDLNLVV